MNRYVIGLLVVLGFGVWGYSAWQDRMKDEERRIAQEARAQALKASVDAMVLKSNAVKDWAASLTDGKRMRTSPVMTAELQKLWRRERPILFIGNLGNVAINADGTYQVTVEYNWLDGKNMLMGSEIRVNLRCPESVANPLIESVKRKAYRLNADTAITGIIEGIETTEGRDSTGEAITTLTGHGRCIDAIFLSERLPPLQ